MKLLTQKAKLVFATILCACLAFSLFMMGYLHSVTTLAHETPASVTNAIKITIDTESDAFKTDVAKVGSDTKIVFGVSPLPSVNDTGSALKNNDLGTWWNAWGEVTVSYDFWSPTLLAGMGGVNFYLGNYLAIDNADLVDQNGYTSSSYEQDFVTKNSNGWMSRTFTFTTDQVVADMFFTFSVQKDQLPTSGKIEMYYSNIKLSYNNNTYDIFGTETSLYSVEGVNLVAKGEALPGAKVKEAGVVICTAWDRALQFAGTTNAGNLSMGATFAAVEAPSVCAVDVQIPEVLNTATEYNLLSFATSSGQVGIESVVKDTTIVDSSTADFSKFTFAESGKYSISYTATQNGYTAKRTVGVNVSEARVPVIVDKDVEGAIPATGFAHEEIVLGKVFASVNGVKDLAAMPVVKDSQENDYPVTEKGNNYVFTPKAKSNETYTVYYSAQNDYGTATSISKQIIVTDIDKPVIDFSGLSGFNVGSFYTVDQVKDLIEITDISDGTVEIDEISIIDPIGDEMVNDEEKFMVRYSGEYKVIVTSAQDSDGNVTTDETTTSSNQSKGLVLGVVSKIAEADRAQGVEKTFDTQIFKIEPYASINVGDVIKYDVMAYTEYDDGTIGFISGLGAINGQIMNEYQGVSWPFVYSMFDKVDGLDATGESMKRTADLSDKLQDDAGNAIWYSRSYTVASGDALYGAPLYHFAVTFSTTDACGSKIVVYYRNAAIYDAEGNLKQVLWDGTQTINREWTDGTNNTKNSTTVCAALDVSPVIIEGKVPATAIYGEEINISKNLMKDALTDSVIDVVLTVTDPDGNNVEYTTTNTGFTLTLNKLGTYKVKVFGSNGIYSTEKVYDVAVSDNLAPVIEITADKDKYVSGDVVTITVSMTDNICDMTTFTDKNCVLTKDGAEVAGATITATETGYTVTFTAEVGSYKVLAYCTDIAGLETVEDLTVVSEEKPASNGCGGFVNVNSTFAIVVLFLATCVLVLKKHKI